MLFMRLRFDKQMNWTHKAWLKQLRLFYKIKLFYQIGTFGQKDYKKYKCNYDKLTNRYRY